MIKKISLVAVAAGVVALALTSCVKAPVSGLLDTRSLDGTWQFDNLPVRAVIDGASVTVTVGTGVMPISTDLHLSKVTLVTIKGTLTAVDVEEDTFMLTLASGEDAITVMLTGDVMAPADQLAHTSLAKAAIETIVTEAQQGTVKITLNTGNVYTMVDVQGSFIDALLAAAGLPPSPMGLPATRVVS